MSDLISRADAIEAVTDIQDGSGQRYYLAVSLVDKIRSLPSADITETEACQKCQDVTDKILNRQGEEIERLKSIINVLNRPSAEAVQTQAEKCDECIHKGAHKDKMTCKECVSAEAVQGEWKRVPTRTYKGECTNCGFRHIFMDGHDSQYRFCPYCGAKMKGGEQNDD